jgi:DNA modification methylase
MITNEGVKLIHGDCLEVLKEMPDNSVDSIVTDPPYGLSFMGKKWDYDVPEQAIWEECLRVLKPGGHLLAFAGTRTQHRMAIRIEDAGFEIRDMIAWVYGSGFPKSMDVSKAIDKAAGAVREVVGFDAAKSTQQTAKKGTQAYGDFNGQTGLITVPATDAARKWEGWGTALKPALEPITVARKPFKGTVAANVLEWGTGAINIDEGRVVGDVWTRRTPYKDNIKGGQLHAAKSESTYACGPQSGNELGRWPANLIHDGSDETTELLGDAARFFYCAKTSLKDRGEGNTHPTVKPTDLMVYLCRLVTPPGGVVLDPFMGSGSTGKAAVREGFRFIGIEMDADYLAIAEARIAHEAGK